MGIHSQRTSDCIKHQIEEAINLYSSMVYRIAYAKMQSKHDADDVFQEVFVRYITNTKPFDSEEHRKNWLVRVTLNCCNNTLTSSWFKKTQPLGQESFTHNMDMEELELFEALMKLPVKYRVVICLFYYEDMPVKKVASVLGISSGNVRVQLNRARAMLKEHLKGDDLHGREKA